MKFTNDEFTLKYENTQKIIKNKFNSKQQKVKIQVGFKNMTNNIKIRIQSED